MGERSQIVSCVCPERGDKVEYKPCGIVVNTYTQQRVEYVVQHNGRPPPLFVSSVYAECRVRNVQGQLGGSGLGE